MAEEGKSRYSRREKELEKPLNIKIIQLQEQLKDKESQLENFQTQFKKLYDDFTYNLELIYERDKDIESLNKRLQEMTKIISSKDSEIRELKQNSQRLKQLEQENAILYKKLESLTQDHQVKIPGQYLEPRPPRLDYKNLLKDNRNMITKKISSYNNSISEKNQVSSSKEPVNIDKTTKLTINMNFDLEERIKALQEENSSKDRKSSSLAHSRVLEATPEYDEDTSDIPKKVKKTPSLHIKHNTLDEKPGKKQEKEIGELIKSLQMYKKQSEANSRSKLKAYDDQISALNEDIDKLRSGDVRSASRNGQQSEDGDKKCKQFARPRSSFETR
ncbi:hypothetical protein SteCoe_7275 [Stentor coeruleus]|uniref:Uncharacterized protein n=1 Tax=Stentor coeruleus TaxID=5963 RepID=A0A1R2CN46_9CILI|nr:hypothetical protein SteCoe_7275 [Stentor coeruleus]